MGDKKGKALALELIDDLLADDAAEIELDQSEKSDHHHEDDHGDRTDVSAPEDPVESSFAVAIDLGRTEVSDATEISGADIPPLPPQQGEGDRTLRIDEARGARQHAPSAHGSPSDLDDHVRASVGRSSAFRSSGPVTATEAALAQSESLRIAQARLIEYEQEIERLRLQNEELAAAGETLRRRTDELQAENQKHENNFQHSRSSFEQEKEILLNSKEALQREIAALKQKNEELELRISTNIQKIRVRERELENRLELVKMESAALIRSKDEMILDVKRQIDQLNLELNNYRTKNQELNRLAMDKQEMLRRTVKALRLALSMLEGEEDASAAKPASAPRKAK